MNLTPPGARGSVVFSPIPIGCEQSKHLGALLSMGMLVPLDGSTGDLMSRNMTMDALLRG